MSPDALTISGTVIVPGVERDALDAATIKALRQGHTVAEMTGIAAQIGVTEELWLSKQTLHADVNGDIMLDLRRVRMHAGVPFATVTVMDDGTFSVDFSAARLRLRRDGWLRVDPVLKEFSIDPKGLLDLPKDMYLEAIKPCKSVKFWRRVAQLNDVSYRPEFAATAQHQAFRHVLTTLEATEAEKPRETATKARKNMQEWLSLLQEANKPDVEPYTGLA
jgi:hypothetical protein